jgi:hypothetical protein
MASLNLFNDEHEKLTNRPHISKVPEVTTMLLKLGSIRLFHAPMEVELKLDQIHRDAISGQVTLCTESAADLTTVILKLSETNPNILFRSMTDPTYQKELPIQNVKLVSVRISSAPANLYHSN